MVGQYGYCDITARTLSGKKLAFCDEQGKYSSVESLPERSKAKSGGSEIAVQKRGSRSIRATTASRRDRYKAARYKISTPKSAQGTRRVSVSGFANVRRGVFL